MVTPQTRVITVVTMPTPFSLSLFRHPVACCWDSCEEVPHGGPTGALGAHCGSFQSWSLGRAGKGPSHQACCAHVIGAQSSHVQLL